MGASSLDVDRRLNLRVCYPPFQGMVGKYDRQTSVVTVLVIEKSNM